MAEPAGGAVRRRRPGADASRTRSPPTSTRCARRRSPRWRSRRRATRRAASPDALLFEVGAGLLREQRRRRSSWSPPALLAGTPRGTRLAPSRALQRDRRQGRRAGRARRARRADGGLSVTADAPALYHPGRSGIVRQGPKLVLATFGELHPSRAGRARPARPGGGVRGVPRPHPRAEAPQAAPPPTCPPSSRSGATSRSWCRRRRRRRRAAGGARGGAQPDRSASLFDVYQGDKLPPGQKSVARRGRAAAARADADRRRDRGGGGQGRGGGGEGDRRRATLSAGPESSG